MGNYLDDLVETNLNPANVIQPRLPSFFEPIRSTAPVAAEVETIASMPNALVIARAAATPPAQDTVLEPPRREPTVASAKTDAARRPEQTRRAEPADDTVTLQTRPVALRPKAEKHLLDAPRLSGMLVVEQTRPVALHPKAEKHLLDAPRLSGMLVVENDPRLPAPSQLQLPQTPVAAVPRAPLAQSIPQVQRLQVPSQINAPQFPASEQESVTPARDNVVRTVEIEHRNRSDAPQAPLEPDLQNLPAMIVAQPKITRHVEPCAPEPAQPSPAPIIRVTIGRIEVRAIHPAPTPLREPAAPPQPKISLDDYLRSARGANG